MKIGVVTLWQSNDNYGQQLQCWALQRYLLREGHQVFLIRYDVDKRFNYNISYYIKSFIKFFICYRIIKYRKAFKQQKYLNEKNALRDFKSFRDNNFIISDLVYRNLFDLKNNFPKADMYITGSDQVWAHLLNIPENKAFYLDFGLSKTKRISYAASFAMDEYPDGLKSILKEQLYRFNAISVRENSGVEICSKLGYSAIKVVDPTLLLSSSDYDILVNNIECKVGKFVYIYTLNISNPQEVEWDKIKRYAQNYQYKILVTPASGYIPGIEIFDSHCVEYDYATIPGWINNIRNAKLVITTSFHGVVFCILQHTPFIYFPLKGRFERGNNRVLDLLKELELMDRIFSESCSLEKMVLSVINWSSVEKKLCKMKKTSISFLNSVLS